MTKRNKNIINIIIGLLLFAVIAILLPKKMFTQNAAIALATMALMIYWWITKPVHLAITALFPIIITSIFNIVPIATVLDDYASPIVVLLLGANILTLTWTLWELDKRISLRVLILLGTSFRQQLIIWFLISTVLSAFLPNAVVAATLCPIALAMLAHCSHNDDRVANSNNKYWILLAIVWGAGLGGFGTPMGGAMNLVAIGHIENLFATEYMYITWIIKMLPYLIGLVITVCIYFLFVKLDVKKLTGSKEYFIKSYKQLGRMGKGEKTAIILFILAIVFALTRPLYEMILPTFKPPYVFLIIGVIAFFLKGDDSKPLITWEYALKNLNWSLMILFSGGMAVGNLLVTTGASNSIAQIVIDYNITGELGLLIVFIILGIFLSNTSSNTAACAVLIPVVIAIVSSLAYNPMPYIYVSAAACNSAFLLPTSIRVIPLAYGMDTTFMLKRGTMVLSMTFVCLVILGYTFIIIAR